jgi:hypothetical protein
MDTSKSEEFEEQFLVRNPFDEPILAELRLDLDQPGEWEFGLDPLGLNEPFKLEPGEEVLVTFFIDTNHLEVSGKVTVVQVRVDTDIPEIMGGMTYELAVSGQ